MGPLRNYVLAFVLGFGSCALTARLLLPVPVQATSSARFQTADAADVVSSVGDSVVSIESYPAAPGLRSTSLWPRLFGGDPAGSQDPNSVASGVIISDQGHIVTNQHVVEDAGRLRVRLADGREFDARVLGSDSDSDLAVLKIRAKNVKTVRLGESQKVRAGDPVVAIGNPLGFENSVSLGVVSANRRGPLRIDGSILGDMIQTDAAINQGNSGGGLFTADGRLIGINSAIMVPRGGSGSIGIGFAIPTHRMRPVVEELIASGKVSRPWLGIKYHLPGVGTLVRRVRHGIGVMVEDVVPGSPAYRAGIRPADILKQLGDRRIRAADDVYDFIDHYRPGEQVKARVIRGGTEKVISVRLAEKPG